jgi:hypothetical protein
MSSSVFMEWGTGTIAEAFVQYNMKGEEWKIAGGVGG